MARKLKKKNKKSKKSKKNVLKIKFNLEHRFGSDEAIRQILK